MFKLKTKHEKDSARLTMVIGLLIILLIFIVGPKYMDPPEEYGIAVNFGTTDFGSGQIQPKEPIRSEPVDNNEQPKVQESQPEPAKQESAKEEVLTEENAEEIAIKKAEEAEAKRKAEAEAKAKAEAERLERERKEREAKEKNIDDLIGGIGKSDGTETGNEGDDDRAGDKGQIDGDPYAPSYFGQPGTGSGGVGYGLNGRGRPTKKKFVPDCDEEGRVVVEVHVDRGGRVVNAVPGKRGTTGAYCLYDAAKKTALSYKWPADSKAPSKQIGFVVVNFTVTQ
ncbi:MAG: energy transducer TonB [Bacteroidia bacterium]|nr:energy transducer TonB [Bacteroidia bacterium]NNF81791.1 energy transducer TonB [Flavobacteriaceae bacterium]MBT8268850.1 energy transducer TonB [Bacteroidia bacterium]MBT8286950.1 energy transducer TonB [Bacteroidia bacterium]NNK70988.1 energy transducer TonB [Flavobacteriaceae bacterium]